MFGEYVVKIPSRFGRGYISGINFTIGVGLFLFELKFKEKGLFLGG